MSATELVQPTIYLDYASTTPIDPQVIEKMLHFLGPAGQFGNASALHHYGRQAAKAIEHAEQQVAGLINAPPHSIIWTSGATEAINLALKGIMQFHQQRGRHLITCQTEHSASLAVCQQLAREGFVPTYLGVQADGLLDLAQLEAMIRPDTVLVSIMHVNNETGVIQDIDTIAQLTQPRGIFLHVDAAQSAGKLPIDVTKTPIDLLSLSAHKLYGPKGVGALYLRPTVQLSPQIQGGGQQRGLRAGTLANHQIVGMGEACDLARCYREEDMAKLKPLRDLLWQGIQELGGVYCHGHPTQHVPTILNLSFCDLSKAVLLPALRNLAVTTGSACQAASLASSHVLKAMGVNAALAQGAIRLSLGRFTHRAEILAVIAQVQQAVTFLRGL